MRRRLIIASIFLGVIVAGVAGILFAINRTIESRNGPVYHFTVPKEETFLTDDRAASVAREVMNRDGLPESAWELMKDNRTRSPDDRPDQYLTRGTINSNQGSVHFYCANAPRPQRYVNVELRNGEITAQGSFGK
jgi:hypothetical protein